MSDNMYILGLLAVTGGITIFLRALPFIVLGRGGKPTPVVQYIGMVLAPAAIAMLAVYCLADYFDAATEEWSWSHIKEVLSPVIASVVVVVLQYWKRNSLVSIIAGTAVYMVMLQLL